MMIKPLFVILITLLVVANTTAQTPEDSFAIFNYCIANIESSNNRLYSEIEYYERNISDFPKTYKDKIYATLTEVDKYYLETVRIQKHAALEDSIVFNNDPYIEKTERLLNYLLDRNINNQTTQPLNVILKRFEKTVKLSNNDFYKLLQYTRIEILFIKQDILMMYLAGIDKCGLDCNGH